MFSNTKALLTYKAQGEQLFNFVVLSCHAIPHLRRVAEGIVSGDLSAKLEKPEHFKDTPATRLLEYAKEYKDSLGKHIIISTFSYFEAYVSDAVEELLDFHGGDKSLASRAISRCRRSMESLGTDVRIHRGKLQDSYNSRLHDKYQKHTRALQQAGFKFPGELFSAYGIQMFKEHLDKLKAFRIVSLLRDGLLVPLSEAQTRRLETIRGLRNKIAHGERHRVGLQEAIACSRDLRNLAVLVDQHLVANFFVIEKFA